MRASGTLFHLLKSRLLTNFSYVWGPLKRSVLKSPFQNPQNLDEKDWFFHDSGKKKLQIHDETKNRLNTLSHRLLGGMNRGTNEIHAFFIRNAFFRLNLGVA